ncbi:hypothetical protein J2Z64_003051 [Oceanobacillus polygoni]|uniref:Uncharacterized protein n=1 Tax=Oceanobacillus polygoni TaxID=1235259 RepID=A0A9X0YU63_9BACI|nr:hypothetical protein [Oceanobacillus polygoni]
MIRKESEDSFGEEDFILFATFVIHIIRMS